MNTSLVTEKQIILQRGVGGNKIKSLVPLKGPALAIILKKGTAKCDISTKTAMFIMV